MKKTVILLTLFLAFLLAGCGGKENEDPGVTTLIYANMTKDGVDRQAVDRFNQAHTDVQIEVRDYFSEDSPDGKNGKDLLFAEIAAGKTPDIIDMGSDLTNSSRLPYQMMVYKGLLEDLWPYIENDPGLGRESVLEAPLKAAEIDGGLYVAFGEFVIQTVVGAENVIGDRYGWTLDELLDTFDTMPEDSSIVEYCYQKSNMFYYVFSMSIEQYIDWETGECSFDSEAFRAELEFVNSFPAEFDWEAEGGDDVVNLEITDRILSGRQMLSMINIFRPEYIQYADAFFGLGGKAAFVGYPTSDGSTGSSFYIRGPRLAMSSFCQNKDAAWEFIRELFLPKYRNMKALQDMEEIEDGGIYDIPINRADYELIGKYEMQNAEHKEYVLYGGPRVKKHKVTKDELARYDDLVNNINKINLYDCEVYDTAYEVAGAYFAGDKTLDEAVDLIQRRVTLYVNELR